MNSNKKRKKQKQKKAISSTKSFLHQDKFSTKETSEYH